MMLDTGLSITGLAASIGTGLIFLTAGIEKLRHRAVLPGIIANYRLLPDALIGPASTVLPLVEIALGAALVIGLAPLPVLLAAGLLGLFAAAMGINIVRGRSQISCGCGRPDLSHPLSWSLVARNLAIAALLLVRLLPTHALSPIDLMTAIATGAGVWLAYALLTSIGALVAAPAPASRR